VIDKGNLSSLKRQVSTIWYLEKAMFGLTRPCDSERRRKTEHAFLTKITQNCYAYRQNSWYNGQRGRETGVGVTFITSSYTKVG
jgi:hypothetical protein